MPDRTTISTPDTGASSQYQGVSNPPNGGSVSAVDTPPSEMQGGTPAPQGQPAPATPQGGPTPSDDGTGQQQPGQAPQGPQGPQQGQWSPQQDKTPSDSGTSNTSAPPVHPAVAKASLFSQVAQALAGGPRTTYKINPDTGVMEKTQVPLSKGQLGMALAFEALSGSITGLAQQGPNATAKAAAAGFQQAQQQQQEKTQQAQKMASDDYARHAQITETNMRMRSMALQVGKQGIEAHNDYIGQFAPIAEKTQRDHPEAVYGTIHHSEFGKYNVTEDMATPVKAVRRVNAQGQPVSDENGEPLWDDLYMVFKPGFKAEDLISPDALNQLKEQGHPFASNQLIGTTAQKASLAMGLTSQAAQYGLAKSAILDAQGILNGGTPSTPDTTSLKDLEIKDPIVNNAIGPAVANAAAKYKVDPTLLGKLYKGVLMQESGATAHPPDNTSSPKGPAMGPGQVIPETAKRMGIKDPHDPVDNINGTAALLAEQLAKYGDPMKALAAYNGTGPDAQDYAKQVAARIGLSGTSVTAPTKQLDKPDWAALNKANPVLPSDMAKFQSAFSAANNSYGSALNHLAQTDPESAGRIVNQFFGGDITNGQKVDQKKALDVALNQEQQRAAVTEGLKDAEAAKTDARNNARIAAMEAYTQPPAGFTYNPNIMDMSLEDAESSLKAQGVKIPPAFASLLSVAHNDLSMKDYSNKVYNNGKQNELDAQNAGSFINRFLNRGYREGDYARLNSLRTEASSSKSDIGRNLQSAGTFLQHAQDLDRALDAADPNTQLGLLNHLAIAYGVQTGDNNAAVLRSIAPAVAEESLRAGVANAGKPYEDQVAERTKAYSDMLTKGQGHAILDAHRSLVFGKINTMDDNYHEQTGEHLKISPTISNEFRKHGFNPGWDNGGKGHGATQQQQPQAPTYTKHTADGKLGLNKATNTWEPITSQAK